jgi:glycosyltransferase involved in cell wall biosynthesis
MMRSRSSFADSLWRRRSPSEFVDVMHHPMGVFFPLHERANVLTLHDLIPYHFPQFCPKLTKAWFDECLVRHLAQVDLIITPSHQTKRDLAGMLGVDEEEIRPIHHAPHERFRPIEDRERIQAVKTRHGLGQRPYLINVSTLAPHKNQQRLVEAFYRLRQEEAGLDHQLVLVGSEGWKFERVLAAIREFRLDAHVHWLGYVPAADLPALLSGADGLVFPSLYEGFGLPPLEAMACGTPVIASCAASLPEVVGDAALRVDPYQVEELAAAMQRLVTDGALRAALRARGLAWVKHFSWEQTARKTLAVYEEAFQRTRGKRRRRPRLHISIHRERHGEIITAFANLAP